MPMRIGISIGTAFSTSGPRGQREGPSTVLGQMQAAKRAGLDSLTLGDHHSTGPGGYVQNVPMLGRLLAEWTDRPAGCLFLVPLWNPVLMAEQIGTLAAMSSGPFIVQAGLGGGDAQFEAMGADLAQRAARLEEGILVVQALLRGEAVDSELWAVQGARVAPLPPEGTEWWIGGESPRRSTAPPGWVTAGTATPTSRRRRPPGTLRSTGRRAPATTASLSVSRSARTCSSPRDRAEAEKVGDALVAGGYRGFERGAVAYGDPESVADQLSVFGELGFTDIIIRTMSPVPPELGPDAAARSVELAADVRSRLA